MEHKKWVCVLAVRNFFLFFFFLSLFLKASPIPFVFPRYSDAIAVFDEGLCLDSSHAQLIAERKEAVAKKVPPPPFDLKKKA